MYDGRDNQRASYEEILHQAVMYPPISIYEDPTIGMVGIYRLHAGRVRSLPVADVERKKRELLNILREQREKL